jgi:hypothetical protein
MTAAGKQWLVWCPKLGINVKTTTPPIVRKWLREQGAKGGAKSKRTLTSEQARKMVEIRERNKRKEQP